MSIGKDLKTKEPGIHWGDLKAGLTSEREALLKATSEREALLKAVALKEGTIYQKIRRDWTNVRPAGMTNLVNYPVKSQFTFPMIEAADGPTYHALEKSHRALNELILYWAASPQDRAAFDTTGLLDCEKLYLNPDVELPVKPSTELQRRKPSPGSGRHARGRG